MKGQMFIIAGLIVIVAMVGLKSVLTLQPILENQRYLVAGLDSLEFSNIRSEMTRVLQISFNSSSTMTDNLNNFNSFLSGALSSKSVEFNSLLVEVFYPTLTANTDTIVNVTVYNSLKSNMQFLNLTFNGTSNTTALTDGNIWQTSFTINTAFSNNQTLTVFYNTSSTSQTEAITIPLTLGTSQYVAFFDIRYISNRGQQSDKFSTIIQLA